MFGTLMGAAVTQIFTNRREAARDHLKWEQERYTRELETRSTALSAAISAISRWYMTMHSFNTYLNFQELSRPITSDLDELARQARDSLASVQLHCSAQAADTTLKAIQALEQMAYELQDAFQDSINDGTHYGAGIDVTRFEQAVGRLRDIYHVELAELTAWSTWERVETRLRAAKVVSERSKPDLQEILETLKESGAEPVAQQRGTRSWLRLPWRRTATPATQLDVDDHPSE
ncbi:hypothetical protein [Lentzea guizhouensis]|uniref:hypothetical protein n=1 Tax=Lentzea guizhouensis TaxID=1586287 RepID=UPI0012B699F4|nr:hypothetical protein [Lentzea guizhouensis]